MNRLRIPHYFPIRVHKTGACSVLSNRTQKDSGTCDSIKGARTNWSCASKREYGPVDVGRCTLRNGIKVVSARTCGAQMASCTILYQSGSRFEIDDQLGATHFLRSCSSSSGCAYTSFSKTRVLQQLGAYITVNSDRQSIAYTLRCPASAFPDVKYYLLDIAARAHFKQYAIDDRKIQLKQDLHNVHPEVRVMDLVQKACWAGGLNNSVFCEEERIDSMSAKYLDAFAAMNMRSDGCTVGSYGLPFEDLMKFAEMIEPKTEAPLRARCYPYSFARGGFEYYDLGPNSDTWIAVAVPSCGSMDPCLMMKHSIVAAACGTGDSSHGQHRENRISHTPLACCATDMYTQLKAFNISYADTGVFGIVAKTRSCSAAVTACTITNFLRRLGDLTCEQIKIGKQRLKLDIALNDNDCVNISEGLALQTNCDVRMDGAQCAIDMLNNICENEVSCVAKTLASKCDKMAVAVVGDIQAVPHDQELKNML